MQTDFYHTIQLNTFILHKMTTLEPIGILDPEGLRPNPLTGKPYVNVDGDKIDSKTGSSKTYAWYAKNVWKKLRVYQQAHSPS